ncbi:MAG: cation diffusion facilitator family transporter [Candidatus Cloacimonadales bacterium]
MDENKEIRRVTIWGLALNLFISVVKFIVGWLGNSQAVIADAVHSFSDCSTDIVILCGVKFWNAPPDESHPYGHKKIESVLTILIGLILFFTALGIGYHAIATISKIDTRSIQYFTLVGPILSLIFKEILFHKTYKIGVRLNSSAVKANAWHHRTDALSSIPVLLAVIASLINPKLIYLDNIGAIIVAAFIIKLAIDIIFQNLNELVDRAVEQEKMAEIAEVIEAHSQVLGYHKIRSRKLGSSVYLDLHLEVDGKMSVTEGHEIASEVKYALLENCPKIIDVVVHLEPKIDKN